MYDITCFNGNFVEYEQLFIHVSDLGLQRGYGIFDFFEIVNGKMKWKEDYLDRFFHSLHLSGMILPYDRKGIEMLVKQVISRNNSFNSYIKLVVTGGYSLDGYSVSNEPNLLILNMPLKPLESNMLSKGTGLITQEFLRPNPEVKSLNYFTSAMLQKKMKEYDSIDVLYHYGGKLAETSRSNIFLIKDQAIHTPDTGILKGITRKNFIDWAKSDYQVYERMIRFEEIQNADEIFTTSTTKGIMPIVRIDGKLVQKGTVGEMTRTLMEGFSDYIH